MNNPIEYALEAQDLRKRFRDGQGRGIDVLAGVCLQAAPGEVLAVVGASGSGKSTLLHILGGLDIPDSGRVLVRGKELGTLSAKSLDDLRNRSLGFVYQFHHLLPEFTALENAAMPLLIGRMPREKALEKARAALDSLGLAGRLSHLPSQLSGGERQRTAIARAMVTNPACILADEPTGNLDGGTALEVFECLLASAKSKGTAVIIVTHDPQIAARCDHRLRLSGGLLRALSAQAQN